MKFLKNGHMINHVIDHVTSGYQNILEHKLYHHCGLTDWFQIQNLKIVKILELDKNQHGRI